MEHDVEVFNPGDRLEGLPVLEPDHLCCQLFIISLLTVPHTCSGGTREQNVSCT